MGKMLGMCSTMGECLWLKCSESPILFHFEILTILFSTLVSAAQIESIFRSLFKVKRCCDI